MNRPKLSIDEQIIHMKAKGIKFEVMSESDAKVFLSDSTYYFKLKAYAKNYRKYSDTDKKGKYINLDFAYLKELSTLDYHLRKLILFIAIDIEHFAKVKLLKDFSANTLEDGYQIVSDFKEICNIETIMSQHGRNSYCYDLVQKYQEDLAIWNIVEMLQFHDFIRLYDSYYRKYTPKHNSYFLPVKFLRNAAAHNNCLLRSIVK